MSGHPTTPVLIIVSFTIDDGQAIRWRNDTATVVDRFTVEGVLEHAGNDTTSQHRGEHVYCKGCHRGAVRSNDQQLVHH